MTGDLCGRAEELISIALKIVGSLGHRLRGVQMEAVVTLGVGPMFVWIWILGLATIESKCRAQLVFAI